MAQYTTINSTTALTITDGITNFRFYVDGTGDMFLQQYLVLEQWEDIEQYVSENGLGTWRVGARDGHWVIDNCLDGTGFSGIEGVSWQNIEAHKL